MNDTDEELSVDDIGFNAYRDRLYKNNLYKNKEKAQEAKKFLIENGIMNDTDELYSMEASQDVVLKVISDEIDISNGQSAYEDSGKFNYGEDELVNMWNENPDKLFELDDKALSTTIEQSLSKMSKLIKEIKEILRNFDEECNEGME